MPSFGVQGVGAGYEVDRDLQDGARVFGEGLGGGYRTPPNEHDVSAANAERGGGWGGGKASKRPVIHRRFSRARI